jgi:hypothetical protein
MVMLSPVSTMEQHPSSPLVGQALTTMLLLPAIVQAAIQSWGSGTCSSTSQSPEPPRRQYTLVRPPELLVDELLVDELLVDEPVLPVDPEDDELVELVDPEDDELVEEVADPPAPVSVLVEAPPPEPEEHAAVAARQMSVMFIHTRRMRGSFR